MLEASPKSELGVCEMTVVNLGFRGRGVKALITHLDWKVQRLIQQDSQRARNHGKKWDALDRLANDMCRHCRGVPEQKQHQSGEILEKQNQQHAGVVMMMDLLIFLERKRFRVSPSFKGDLQCKTQTQTFERLTCPSRHDCRLFNDRAEKIGRVRLEKLFIRGACHFAALCARLKKFFLTQHPASTAPLGKQYFMCELLSN